MLDSARPQLERLLERRLNSVSTFVSSENLSLLNREVARETFGKGRAGSTDVDGPPTVILFPNKPCSRADAVILDQWISNALESYARRSETQGILDDKQALTRAVEELVPVLSIGLHEVVRQVTHHCLERSVVLEKIWRTYVELLERALNETRASLRKHKERTSKVEAQLAKTRQDLSELRERHPEQISKLSKTLTSKFNQRQEEMEEKLRHFRVENNALQQHLKIQVGSLCSWFPLFDKYKDSSLRQPLELAERLVPTSVAPESAIAADFHRIVLAMDPDRRRRVSFFVSSLLGLRSGLPGAANDTVEGLSLRRDHNLGRIEELESRLRDLEADQGSASPTSPTSPSAGVKFQA